LGRGFELRGEGRGFACLPAAAETVGWGRGICVGDDASERCGLQFVGGRLPGTEARSSVGTWARAPAAVLNACHCPALPCPALGVCVGGGCSVSYADYPVCLR
jgi:hypothetical protein